jgi:hypothetical protein
MRHHEPGEYSFHINLAYTMCRLTQGQMAVTMALSEAWRENMPVTFELGAPECCLLNDIFASHRQVHLVDS